MSSLRARQKLIRRENMLNAARTLFVERGYSRTTMDAIAEHAEVGVATVHTYFSTKEGVFAELARMDMSELKSEGEALLTKLPADPIEAVNALLDIYFKVQNYISFEVMRDFAAGSKHSGPMREVAVWINHWQSAQLTEALKQGKAAGRVSDSLPLEELSYIIVDLLIRSYDRVTFGEDSDSEFKKLKQRVRLLFADWRS